MGNEFVRHDRVSIVVPCYREAENLPILVPRIMAALDAIKACVDIVIVDDNSPDNTPACCDKLARDFPVRLLVRDNERGLSSAVLHGIQNSGGEIIVVMDADLSHPPEKIPDLIAVLVDRRADFVIGSRYVSGGTTEVGWGLYRWLNSKVATLLARPLTSALDPMAGFFALRRETFERARDLDPIGYKIALELIVKCDCQNVAEVPITFADRIYGESKLNLKEQWNYIRHLKRLYQYKMGARLRSAARRLTGRNR